MKGGLAMLLHVTYDMACLQKAGSISPDPRLKDSR